MTATHRRFVYNGWSLWQFLFKPDPRKARPVQILSNFFGVAFRQKISEFRLGDLSEYSGGSFYFENVALALLMCKPFLKSTIKWFFPLLQQNGDSRFTSRIHILIRLIFWLHTSSHRYGTAILQTLSLLGQCMFSSFFLAIFGFHYLLCCLIYFGYRN